MRKETEGSIPFWTQWGCIHSDVDRFPRAQANRVGVFLNAGFESGGEGVNDVEKLDRLLGEDGSVVAIEHPNVFRAADLNEKVQLASDVKRVFRFGEKTMMSISGFEIGLRGGSGASCRTDSVKASNTAA